MKISVLEMRMVAGDKPLKAFVDIQVDDWIIRELRVIKEANKRTWVVSPQLSWKDPVTGSIKYKTILTLPGDVKGEVDRLILNRFAEEMEKRNEAG
jgi:DNA-binding cell septation regulator SpoVG